MTEVAISQFPILDDAMEWYNAYAQDHDAEFLLYGVTHGFLVQNTDPDPDRSYYGVGEYLPPEHAHMMVASVRSDTGVGRYINVNYIRIYINRIYIRTYVKTPSSYVVLWRPCRGHAVLLDTYIVRHMISDVRQCRSYKDALWEVTSEL
jgi:hypothetical protein